MRRGGSDNTGGVTQAFGSLHRAITSRLGQGELPEAEVLLEKIELVAAEKWANSFGLPEIMMMKELMERAPQLFRRTIVACDGNWHDESCPSRFKLGALAAYVAFFFSYHAGVAPVPWIAAAESFPSDVRGAAVGVAAAAHFFANATLEALYPVMFEALGAAVTLSMIFVCAKAAFGFVAAQQLQLGRDILMSGVIDLEFSETSRVLIGRLEHEQDLLRLHQIT